MSLEFNRRSFLKYTAVAAVALAGSSLLTGCSTEFAKTIKKFGTIDNMDVKATLSSCSYTEAGTAGTAGTVSPVVFDNSLAFYFEAKNSHTNPIYLDAGSFSITVNYTETKTDPNDSTKTITETNSKIYGSGTGNDYYLTNNLFNHDRKTPGIKKDQSASGYIYLQDAPQQASIESIIILYHCDSAFSKYADIWELTYDSNNSGFTKVTSITFDKNRGALTITE